MSVSRTLPADAHTWLRVEDGALAAWSLALPAVAGWFGAAGGSAAADAGPNALVGLAQLIAVAGALAALLTRPPDQPRVHVAGQEAPRWIISSRSERRLKVGVVSRIDMRVARGRGRGTRRTPAECQGACSLQ